MTNKFETIVQAPRAVGCGCNPCTCNLCRCGANATDSCPCNPCQCGPNCQCAQN